MVDKLFHNESVTRELHDARMKELAKMEIPECLDCGACCTVFTVPLCELDARKVPVSAICASELDPSDKWSKFQLKKKPGTSTCAQFDSETNKCGIYKNRPFNCSGFPRGGPSCRMAIEVAKERDERNNSASDK